MAKKRTKYDDLFQAASRKYGIPANVLAGQDQIESSFDPNAISPAGAFGVSQFMPGTAAGYGVKRGNVKSQIFGQAHYLKDLGYNKNPSLALSGYNAGPGNPGAAGDYASKVLAAAKQYAGSRGGALPPVSPSPGGAMQTLGTPAARQPDTSNIFDTLSRIGAASGLNDPEDPVTQNWGVLSAALRQREQRTPTAPTIDLGTVPQSSVAGGSTFDVGGKGGKVHITPGSDRAGVSTSKNVLNFAAKVAGIVGHDLVLGTGSHHDQYTVSGNVSDHWTGNAGDFPSEGERLTRMGQAALVAAGMPAAQARKIKGGLFNLNYKGKRVQIIFNTNAPGVGNHFDHLHIGIHNA